MGGRVLARVQAAGTGRRLGQIWQLVTTGEILELFWVSVHRAVIGFALSLLIAVPLGLAIANITVVRRGIGPLVSGLQSLPSVAWVPAAILWFGLNDRAIYWVVLLGAVPSIANGLVSGLDQVPPILPRVGKALGAGRLGGIRYILLPAALPGFLGGLKQGWAFSWRSLMAAELIATSPELGEGLGQYPAQRDVAVGHLDGVRRHPADLRRSGSASSCWCSARWRTRCCGRGLTAGPLTRVTG